MKNILAAICIIFSIFMFIKIENDNETTNQVLVVKVIDWDTFSFYYKGNLVNTRMIGIDAPESNTLRYGHAEKGGKQAKAFLHDLIDNKIVTIKYDSSQSRTDVFNRHLVYVYLDWVNINKLMISNCHAKEYTFKKAYLYQDAFKQAEKNCK